MMFADVSLTTKQVIVWWELRRLLYNLILLIVGIMSIAGMEYVLAPIVPLGQDVIEPMLLALGVVAYAIGANVCYTLGWITELILRKSAVSNARVYG